MTRTGQAPRSHDGAQPPLATTMARNSLLNLLGLGLPLLVAVFSIPPLLDGLGAARFGLLGLVWVAIAYLNLLDMGLGRATTRFAAPAIRDGDDVALGSILGVASALQLALGVAGAALAVAFAPAFVRRFLDLSGALEIEATAAFVTLAFAAPALTLASSFRGVLEAGQRFGVINAIRVPVSTANFVVPLIGVWLGWSLPQMVFGLVAVRVLGLLGYATVCLRTWTGLGRRLGFDRARVRQLLSFGGWVTVSSVIGSLLLYVDRIAIGGVASIEAAGYYTVPHEVVTRLEILPASLVLTLFPALAALAPGAAGRRAGGELFDRSVLLLLAIVAPPLLTLALAGNELLTIWLGGEFAVQAAGALRLLSLGMIGTALAYIPYAAIQAAGRPDLTARLQLAELPVYLVLLWLLIARWGIEGAAAAWMVRAMVDALLMYVAAWRLGLTEGAHLDRLGRLLVALCVYVLLVGGAAFVLAEPAAVIGIAVVALLAWGVWCWRGLLSGSERAHLRDALTVARAHG